MATTEASELLQHLGQDLVESSRRNLAAYERLQQLAQDDATSYSDINGFRKNLTGLEEQCQKLQKHANTVEKKITEEQRNRRRGSVLSSEKKKAPAAAWKAGFRLSEEEQELAYELKAKMMRVLDEQNSKLASEIKLHKRLEETQQRQASAAGERAGGNLSRMSALKLVTMYERRAEHSQKHLDALCEELDQSQALAAEYQGLYEAECKKSGTTPEQRTRDKPATSRPVTARSRGSARGGPDASQRPTTSSSVEQRDRKDAIRLNECLRRENQELRAKIEQQKKENAHMMQEAKHHREQATAVSKELQTSHVARSELLKRLEKEHREKTQLQRSMAQQNNNWQATKKIISRLEEDQRWGRISSKVSVHGARERWVSQKAPPAALTPRMTVIDHN